MIKLIVLFLVCIEISTGYYEEYSGYNGFPSIDNSGTPNFPTPVNNRDPQVRRRMPCPHRRNNPDQEWVSSYKSTITKPFTNYGLEPQSLKNDNVNDENKTAKKLLVRSNDQKFVKNDEQTLDDYDCDNELETETQLSSRSNPKTSVGVEQKAIELLKDCLNKKQKHIEDTLQDDELISGSRRSMGEPDIDLKNDNPDDLEPTTEVSEDKTEVLAPGFTLGPGKLYNELEYQAKTSGIAKYPVSRRMQDSSRICYACSSSTNPTCWAPDNKTTIKYCKEGQNCITKNFGEKDTLTVIRDCAESCDVTGIPGLEPMYKKCKICHNDLCNSAAINGYNIIIMFIIFSFKCAF